MTTGHKKLLKEWQNRLCLNDWKITLIDNCRPEKMNLSDVEGCTTWVEATKTAEIQMLAEDRYPSNCVGRGSDWERCLVHELLHCKLSFLQSQTEETTLQDRVCHQMIDDLARAFVDAKRCGVKQEGGNDT